MSKLVSIQYQEDEKELEHEHLREKVENRYFQFISHFLSFSVFLFLSLITDFPIKFQIYVKHKKNVISNYFQ